MGGEKITKKILVLLLISTLLVTIIITVDSAIAAESGINIFRPTENIIVEWGPGTGSGYTQVDDATPDGTSTYIGTSINGKKDVYSITSQPITGVKNFTVYGRFITDFVGSKFTLILYKKSTTIYIYSTPIQLSRSGTWETISYTWETNPFTETNWTDNDIDDIGIGICADYCDRGSAVFCTQVYLEVAYFIPDPPSNGDDPAIDELMDFIDELNLPKGLKKSLSSKLKTAIISLNKNRLNAVMNKIEAFMKQVGAQSGNKLSNELAGQLFDFAQPIVDNLRDEIASNKFNFKR